MFQGEFDMKIADKTIHVKAHDILPENRKMTRSRAYVWTRRELEKEVCGEPPMAEDFPHLNLETAHTFVGDFPEVDTAWRKYNRKLINLKRR